MRRLRPSLARPGGICRLCGASTGQERNRREEKFGLGQWLFQCGHCRALYLEPDLSPEGMLHFYEQDYRRLYPFEASAEYGDGFLHAIRCRETGLRRARALAQCVPPGGRLLELGSGHGGFLGRIGALRPDLELAAIEPDQAHRALALDGAQVRFLDWDDLVEVGPFHLVVLFHTLEHLTDPVGELRDLASVLAEGGRLVIEVPQTRPEALSNGDVHCAHVTCFTAASLHRATCAAGLVPLAPLAAEAGLPGCLWLEAGKDGPPVPCPEDAPSVIAPTRRGGPKRVFLRVLRSTLPLNWVGRLSRWRHGPAMDRTLAETSGRRFRWGIPFDPLTMAEVLGLAESVMADRGSFRVADINVAKLIGLLDDAAFRLAVLTADATVVDGMGVLWGLRLLGVSVPEKVSGVDLLDHVAALCARRGFRPFIVGARKDVVERAVAELCLRHPGLNLAGWRDGYFSDAATPDVVTEVAGAKADCLIVALPYPRQDLFLAQVQAQTKIPFVFGVGGSLDVLTGDRRRAPLWMQKHGLEWLYRLLQEPWRLGPRYVSSNWRFLIALLSYRLAGGKGGGASAG
jgi:N-acetylglucosaminyldiphosphoundecaprenol N-acetyl-beta-D-mannosaminyltransferase